MRSLIDRIEVVPAQRDGRTTLEISLRGWLAGILGLASKKEKPLDEQDVSLKVAKLVAGQDLNFATFLRKRG